MDGYVFAFAMAISGGLGAAIGQRKSRTGAGFLFGAVLGPLGWLMVGLGPDLGPKCDKCKGSVVAGAVKCRNCGSDLVAG